jgi:peptidoglycan/LPS O-acetylase OafA/YrhL
VVFFHHVPISKDSLFSFFTRSGGIGVAFFFVISGFLITYILLNEKTSIGQISLRKFLMRRVLRIWPLFYAMILFAFLTPYLLNFLHISYSDEGYKPNWLMSMLFLENYQMMITHSFPNVSPLRVMWSLCIEEQFYIIWATAISFISLKRIPHLLVFSILTANIFRLVYGYMGISAVDVFSSIDYFAFGAIPAYLLILRPEILNKIEAISVYVKYSIFILAIVLVFGIPNMEIGYWSYFVPFIYGALFSCIILFTLPERNSIKIKDEYWFSKLGIYTYGLYLFHTIVINLLLHTKHLFPFEMNWVLFSALSLICTILISLISYHIFEKQFLKLKKYFY